MWHLLPRFLLYQIDANYNRRVNQKDYLKRDQHYLENLKHDKEEGKTVSDAEIEKVTKNWEIKEQKIEYYTEVLLKFSK